MGNGQLIHLEIDSGCGVPRKPGQALGNWSRARSRPKLDKLQKRLSMLVSGEWALLHVEPGGPGG